MTTTTATLTAVEAAKLLGIGRNQAYEAIRRGEIPSLRIGGRIVIPRAKLMRLLGESTADELDASDR